jgi:type VI secretion system protein ImpA
MATEFDTEIERLAQPVAVAGPCGIDLDSTSELAALEAQRIFGRLTAPEVESDWHALRSHSALLLSKSKDLRALVHFAAAVARTGTLIEALRVLALLEPWFTTYWNDLYPRLDEDALARRNALNCFADRVAIIDPLRRLPIVTHPQLGAFSLRDIDIAMGAQPNPDSERAPRTETEVSVAIQEANAPALRELYEHAQRASAALKTVQEMMGSRCGAAAVPTLEPLIKQLARIQQLLSVRMGNEVARDGGGASSNSDESQVAPQSFNLIKSRQEAVSALDAVMEYFRRHEPSSPVPLLVERAKRLVSMDFLEVLADLAPEALEHARKATGAKDTQ